MAELAESTCMASFLRFLPPMSGRGPARIRRDLENRGVAPDFSESLSRHLATIVEPLGADAYEAVLSSVIHACREKGGLKHVRDQDPGTLAGLEEVQRLLGAFTSELQKLEEALETMAAYVTRMRTQTVTSRGETLH